MTWKRSPSCAPWMRNASDCFQETVLLLSYIVLDHGECCEVTQVAHKLWVLTQLCSVGLHDFDICNELKTVTCEQLSQVASLEWALGEKKNKPEGVGEQWQHQRSAISWTLPLEKYISASSMLNSLHSSLHFTSINLPSRWQCCNPSSAIAKS